MNEIQSISIIGSGNVAHHLGNALLGQVKVLSVYSPNQTHCKELAEKLGAHSAAGFETLLPADLILICTSDDAIQSVVASLPEFQK